MDVSGQDDDNLGLPSLADLLSRHGLAEFFACFDPLRPDPFKWRAYREVVNDELGGSWTSSY